MQEIHEIIRPFSTRTTNLFPAVNSHTGGQLLSEWNMRSIGSVETPSIIKYSVGLSFCHAREDFMISCSADEMGVATSSTKLTVSRGRCVLNGHYVESLIDVEIDMVALNEKRRKDGLPRLSGRLGVGLRALYATEGTIAGSILVEPNPSTPDSATDEYFEGLAIIIAPDTDETPFQTPLTSPESPDNIDAHLKLGTFQFLNGAIHPDTISNNYPEKCNMLSSDRIGSFGEDLNSRYISKVGLDPKKLYVFGGKDTFPETGKDNWCNALDSLFIWDKNPRIVNGDPNTKKTLSSQFERCGDGTTALRLVHKQVDGMASSNNSPQYYDDKLIKLPLANFATGAGGTVDASFIANVANVAQRIYQLFGLQSGKQRAYIDVLKSDADPTAEAENILPVPNPDWKPGDYVMVRVDRTVYQSGEGNDPSTLYVLLPPNINTVGPTTSLPSNHGARLAIRIVNDLDWESYQQLDSTFSNAADVGLAVPQEAFGISAEDTTQRTRGNENDYFEYAVYSVSPETGLQEHKTVYYVVNSTVAGSVNFGKDPILLTGNMHLATENAIGGFYNVNQSDLDQGYVWLDNEGRLRLLDYSLLRTGVLAYQLGDDFYASGTGEDVQVQLNDYVNQRVAFPTAEHSLNMTEQGKNPNEIEITLELSQSPEPVEINIFDVDSRFNTSVLITITGDADSKTTVNISDCQRVRLNPSVGGTPRINVYRSCIYYNPDALEKISLTNAKGQAGIQNLSIWYEQFSSADPKLFIDGMTVMDCGEDILVHDLEHWTETVSNDNHFIYALQSITLSPSGGIIGAGLYVKNNSTNNNRLGKYIVGSKFKLTQDSGLRYPRTWMTKEIRIVGNFVTGYPIADPAGQLVASTSVNAVINPYEDTNSDVRGSITFFTDVFTVSFDNCVGLDMENTDDSLEENAFRIMKGGVTNWN